MWGITIPEPFAPFHGRQKNAARKSELGWRTSLLAFRLLLVHWSL